MTLDSIVTVSIFLAGTALIGIGVGAKDPAWAAVVVGSILLSLVIASKHRGGRAA